MCYHILLCMANMTLSLPDEVHARMKKFPEVNWSKVAQRAILEKLEREREFQEIEAIAQKSKLTQKDVDEIGRKIKQGIGRHFRERLSSIQTSSSPPSSRTE